MRIKALILISVVLLSFSCQTTKKRVIEKVELPEKLYLDLKFSKDVRINGKTILTAEERAELERKEAEKRAADASSDQTGGAKDSSKRGKYFKLLNDATFDIEAKYITGESRIRYYKAYESYIFEAVEQSLKESFDASADIILKLERFDLSTLNLEPDPSSDLTISDNSNDLTAVADSTADLVVDNGTELMTADLTSDISPEGVKGVRVAVLIDIYNEGEFNFIRNVASELYFNVSIFNEAGTKVAVYKKLYKVMPDISNPIERHRLELLSKQFVKELSKFIEKRLFKKALKRLENKKARPKPDDEKNKEDNKEKE